VSAWVPRSQSLLKKLREVPTASRFAIDGRGYRRLYADKSVRATAPTSLAVDNDRNFLRAITAINDIIAIMASITIRRLEESTKRRLRLRAARHGRSMEQEAREILKTALTQPEEPKDLVAAIRRRFAKYGGVDLKIPPREVLPEPRIR
jgi:antitoxin FitA